MRHSGQLVVHAGRIQACYEDSCGVNVTIRQRHALENTTLRVSWVVNCTDPAANYRKLQHPLVVDLRSHGLLCPDELALGIKTTAIIWHGTFSLHFRQNSKHEFVEIF